MKEAYNIDINQKNTGKKWNTFNFNAKIKGLKLSKNKIKLLETPKSRHKHISKSKKFFKESLNILNLR